MMAPLALGLLGAGCDSIVGESRASADGGGIDLPTALDGEGSGEVARVIDGSGEITSGAVVLDASVDAEGIDSLHDASGEATQTSLDGGSLDSGLDTRRPDVATQRYDALVDQRAFLDGPIDMPVTGDQDALIDSRGKEIADSQGDRAPPLIVDSAVDPAAPDARDAGSTPLADAMDAPADASLPVPTEVGADIGEIGDANEFVDTLAPLVDADIPMPVKQISAGAYHTCALHSDGTVSCWGMDSDGQSTPPAATVFSQITANNNFTCGLKLDGTAKCWGSNAYGQGTVPSGHFTQLAAGSAHVCAVRTDGKVSCWGLNTSGQCLPPTGTFTQVAAGSAHTCGILTAGTVACWGGNTFNQTVVPSGSFSPLTAYGYHSCAIRGDGSVACWGSNTYKESKPPAGTFVQVGAGYWHSCGVRSDGTVACWGDDSYGQSTPAAGAFTQVTAGMYHTCGLRSDTTIACWGDNSFGQSSPP